MAKIAKVLGRKWQLVTHIIPKPGGSPCKTGLPDLGDIHSRYNGESSIYGSVVGGPEILWVFPFDSAAALDTFQHPFQSPEIRKFGVHDLVESVTTSLHSFVPGASNVKVKGPTAASPFLYNINLKLSPNGVLRNDPELLNKLGRYHEGQVYVYSSAVGGKNGPVVTWQIPLKTLGDLEKIDDPLGTVLVNAGPELAQVLTDSVESISTIVFRKFA